MGKGGEDQRRIIRRQQSIKRGEAIENLPPGRGGL